MRVLSLWEACKRQSNNTGLDPYLTENNHSTGYGGGARVGYDATLWIANCHFLNNSANNEGGALSFQSPGALVVQNSMFESNTAREMFMSNCTLVNNSVYAVYLYLPSHDYTGWVTIENSIIAMNEPNQLFIPEPHPGFDVIIGHNLITGGEHYGEGNISGDPRFLDPHLRDLHLGSDSPCIDAANACYAPPIDIDVRGKGSSPFLAHSQECGGGKGSSPFLA
jgi:hypothetical protein